MKFLYGAAFASLFALSAQAQAQTPPPASSPKVDPPATTSAPPAARAAPAERANPEAGAPMAGANSFTENQARAWVEQQGYANVTGLTKDAEGIWRGTAVKDGQSHKVAVDYRGNVVVSQK